MRTILLWCLYLGDLFWETTIYPDINLDDPDFHLLFHFLFHLILHSVGFHYSCLHPVPRWVEAGPLSRRHSSMRRRELYPRTCQNSGFRV